MKVPFQQESDERATLEILRPLHQLLVALVLGLALLCMVAYWALRWVRQDRMIDVDQAVPKTAVFEVDLNRATWPELVQLPGVGEVTARAIVDERNAHGPYTDLNDLQRRVRGIGPRLIEQIRPFVKPSLRFAD